MVGTNTDSSHLFDRVRRDAASYCDDLIPQLGGYVGLRAFEIPQISPKHVKRTANGDHYRLRVPRGKDTTGSGGKPRNAYLPPSVEGDIHRYTTAESIAPDAPLVDLTERGVRASRCPVSVVRRRCTSATMQAHSVDFSYSCSNLV